MSEYAKYGNERVKIGTCERMYYLRYEDRHRVQFEPGNVDVNRDPSGLFFRLPFPDEDHIKPGGYDDYNRALRLYRPDPCEWCKGTKVNEWDGKQCQRCHGAGTFGHSDFVDAETMEDPGTIQLHHQGSGLLLNVPCYHGMKLPEVSAPMRAFWNGKGWSTELCAIKAHKEADGSIRILPVVHCRHCRQMWRYEWERVWDFIEPAMQKRLAVYREAFSKVA